MNRTNRIFVAVMLVVIGVLLEILVPPLLLVDTAMIILGIYILVKLKIKKA